jgi:hypothetical protein
LQNASATSWHRPEKYSGIGSPQTRNEGCIGHVAVVPRADQQTPLLAFGRGVGGDRRAQARHTVRNRGDGCWIRLHSGGTEKREGGWTRELGPLVTPPELAFQREVTHEFG